MSADWMPVDRRHWRKAIPTAYGGLTAEIAWLTPGGYSVAVRAGAQPGLTVSDIASFAEAQAVGEALLAQFAAEPPPWATMEIEPW